ncbi:hypothetical protein FB45DRAFT_1053179 [Roridomyces roridus]|uniref:F-box domain-containing protein n=1 Tax=Roridomyces roridus TaxID=1738132 RepID=A0AAD7CBP3_9AGAR|nr:hypothetical protein FB45DRAFT_1053179 [Roridomyces roridus]
MSLIEINSRLADTDDEILGTLAHLERLRARRMNIIVELNSATSRFFRLPVEVICQVFTECLPKQNTLPRAHDAPLLLAQVSHVFRSITLSLPALWQRIIVAPCALQYKDQHRAALLDLWVARAGNSPNISVSMIPSPQSWQLTFFHRSLCPIFRSIRMISEQWRELEIVRRLEDFPCLLVNNDPWCVPRLVKLTMLLSHGGRRTNQPESCLSNLMDAPSLRHVHLMGFTPSTLILPWHQLTTVHMENLLPTELIHTLVQCPRLADGTFSLWPTPSFELASSARETSIHLPYLAQFSLSGELVTELFNQLDFPVLALTFLQRSYSLKDVALEAHGAVVAGDFISCVEALGGVEHLQLDLHTGVMNGEFPRALQGNAALLPNLRRLTVKERVDRYNERPLNPAVVGDMLVARYAMGMQAFCLVSTHVWRVGDINPRFGELADKGMEIELRSHGAEPFLVVYYKT